MFTEAERDRVRRYLLDEAHADPAVIGAAITGSTAAGRADRFSDLDLMFGVRGELAATLDRWTRLVYQNLRAVHHWDLPHGPAVYRVFLLPHWLELDLGFTGPQTFGPRGGGHWHLVFGQPTGQSTVDGAGPGGDNTIGLCWHHAWHAWVSIHRGRWWQAAHWIGALRDLVIALAARRLGHPASYAKGAHLLPDDVTGPLRPTLVRSLDEVELRRALDAALAALGEELRRSDPALAVRLRPMLAELETADA